MFSKQIMTVLMGLSLVYLVFTPFIPARNLETTEITSDQFNFSFDVARFRAEGDFVLVELYYAIFRNHLKYVPDANRWKATFNFKAEISKNDSLLATDEWTNFDAVDSLTQITPAQKLFGMGYFAIKPGAYLIKAMVTDINSNYQRQKEQYITIDPILMDKLTLSDIELATQIQSHAEKNRFYKNGYTVIPNPDQFYGTGLPILMFYNEIYNLMDEGKSDTGNYSVQYRILDGDGLTVREFPAKIRTKPGESAVEASGMNIISFRSGTYFLELEVNDLMTGEKAATKKKFYIYREGDLAISDSVSQKLAE